MRLFSLLICTLGLTQFA
jgi:hypothetical protein